MENLGYYNGAYDLIENMTIPMMDRVCAFGDGVYDAAMARNHRIFALDEHLDRIFNGAALLKINVPCTKSEMAAILQDMVRKVDSPDQFVYWQVTRGTQLREHAFDPGIVGNFWIMLFEDKMDDMARTLNVITQEDTRFLHCNIKTLNLLPSVMYTQRARQGGYDEAILYRDGIVTECAHSNVHILKEGVLLTHPTDHLILPGIARAHLIAACKRLGMGVDETPFTLDDLMDADEVIITSSGSPCMRVATVDGIAVGGKASDELARLQLSLEEEFIAATD